MNPAALASFALAAALSFPQLAPAAPPEDWRLPKNSDSYLMEDDLVTARFLRLARGGDYQQINRDPRGSAEVDRGRWEQDAAGTLRLHSTCRALRPRAVKSGPLSVVIASQEQRDSLPRVLASIRHLLGEYADGVFGAGTAAELNARAMTEVQVECGVATFDRADAVALCTRISDTLESENSSVYCLTPVKSINPPLFVLSGSAFQEADLLAVKRMHRPGVGEPTPFYFARIEAKAYAREVGHWHSLHLPGAAE